MANIDTLEAEWTDVPQLETSTAALGGKDGPMNSQAVALVKRLNYLREQAEQLASQIEDFGSEDGASKIGLPLGGTLDQAIDWVKPEMFGATGLPGHDDDTEAFQMAAERAPIIFLTPGRQYKLGDWVPPNGTTIMGFRGMGHFSGSNGNPPIVRRRSCNDVESIFDTRGARELHFRGFHVKGGSYDGKVFDVHCIRVGGYIIHMENLTVYEGATGYGGVTGDLGQNSQIVSCRFGNCIVGITRIVDTSIHGGSVVSCKTHGIALESGNDFNTIRTRVEWNGRAQAVGELTFDEGHNVLIANAKGNILDLTNDRAWLSGVRALKARSTIIRGIARRPGAKGSGFEGRAHVYLKECVGVTVDIVTEKGVDDGGGGIESPLYAIHLDNGGDGNHNITIEGDLSGYLTQPILESNGRCNSLNLLATGSGRPNMLGGRKMIGGQSFADAYQSGNIAPAGTASGSISVPSVGETFATRTYAMRVSVRNSSSNSQQWFAEFPMLVAQAGSGATPAVQVLPVAYESNYSGGNGYISVNGAGTVNIAIGAVSESNGAISIPVTVENDSETLTHKVRIEIV